ncbi:MAG: peptide-methionine (S)-S-oxide reductase MsrA [Bryobacteraceae bacterium]
MAKEVLPLGGGCFWCLEAVFEEMAGVESVESGYMGGETPNPTYRDVCTGASGHAEVVQITYDPEVTNTRALLEVFFAIHDPTTKNRQGNDVGTQYRSVIFYQSEEQKEVAEALIRCLSEKKCYASGIVTEIAPASEFFVAEEYHQHYFRNNENHPYCQYVVAPKVRKFTTKFGARRKVAALG